MNCRKAFSLMELIIVVVIIGIIAGFALTNYDRAKQRNEERIVASRLLNLAGHLKMHRSRNPIFLTTGPPADENRIDTVFGTTVETDTPAFDIILDTHSPDSYGFFAVSLEYGYTARIDIRNIPCCHAGTCRSLPACTCPGGMITCNNHCVDPQVDYEYCGDCSTSCSNVGLEAQCINGVCVDNFNN